MENVKIKSLTQLSYRVVCCTKITSDWEKQNLMEMVKLSGRKYSGMGFGISLGNRDVRDRPVFKMSGFWV